MATFQGFGSQIQELKLQQPSEWTIEEAPGEIVVQNPDPGATKDVAKVKLLMKAGISPVAQGCAPPCDGEMAGFSAYNRLEPWENWADERLQEWNIMLSVTRKKWSDGRTSDQMTGAAVLVPVRMARRHTLRRSPMETGPSAIRGPSHPRRQVAAAAPAAARSLLTLIRRCDRARCASRRECGERSVKHP